MISQVLDFAQGRGYWISPKGGGIVFRPWAGALGFAKGRGRCILPKGGGAFDFVKRPGALGLIKRQEYLILQEDQVHWILPKGRTTGFG